MQRTPVTTTTTSRQQTAQTVRRLAGYAATVALDRIQNRYEQFREYPYHDRMHDAQETFEGIWPIVKRVIYYTMVGVVLLSTSAMTYGVFYVTVMPSHAASEHLNFDYTCRNSPTTTTCPANGASPNCSISLCSPVASVDIFAVHTPWEALHPDVVPEARSKSRILQPRKHYFLEVALQLPESAVNQNAGMFGVKVELYSKNSTILARSTRSARITHESNWISTIRKTICIVPLLVGAVTESRYVVVSSFRHYVESYHHPLKSIVVQLVSQEGGWTDSSPVEVIAGEVRIGKELNAIQNILKEWFWTCFVVGTTVILCIQCILFFVAQILLEAWRLRQVDVQAEEEEADLGSAPYFFDEGDAPFTEDDEEDKWEPTQVEVPEDQESSSNQPPVSSNGGDMPHATSDNDEPDITTES